MSNFGIMRASIAEVAVDQLQKRIRKQKKRKKRNLLRKVKTIVEDQVVHPAILFQAGLLYLFLLFDFNIFRKSS